MIIAAQFWPGSEGRLGKFRMGSSAEANKMTSIRRLRIGADVIEYSLTRSSRRKKTVGLRIARGVVEVAAPVRTPIREIEGILQKRGNWLLDKLAETSGEPPPIRFDSGERIPFLGDELTLLVEEATVRRPWGKLEGDRLLVRVASGLGGEERHENVKAVLEAWYRAQATEFLKDRVAHWFPLMGRREMPRVLVREQKTRWGSCSSDGTLRFSWRLAMLGPELIDSVVVHELAHLEVMNHSPAFWGVVLRVMPDARDRRRRLDKVGRHLPL